MPLISFSAGQRLTAARLNAALDITRTVYQQADQTVNNSTTFVSSSYLTLPLEANSGYKYELFLIFEANSAADFKHNVLLPAGAGVRHGVWTPVIAVSSTNTTIALDALDATAFNSGALTGTKMTAHPKGIIATGGNAGDVTIQFAQASAHASNAILALGSWMTLTRVI